LIAREVGSKAWIVHVPPTVTFACGWIIGRVMNDVTLTHNEVRGLMADLLVSSAPPTAPTRFSEWLHRHADTFGVHYASEIAKR
jgi:NADH dehydrogenase